jgi:membrane fusion protein, heavy metal efflux system
MIRRWEPRSWAPPIGLAACPSVSVGAIAMVCLGLTGCGPPNSPAASASAKSTPPSKVTAATKEADLATVNLTPEAETRLGLGLAAVERKRVPRTITYAGFIEVPSGGQITVASPFNAMLNAPKGTGAPTPGHSVKQGQPILTLMPMLMPEAIAQMIQGLITAEGQVKTTADQLKIAKVNLDRAEKMVKDHLGGAAQVVDAQAQYELAATQFRAAEQIRDMLAKVVADPKKGNINAQEITSPVDGVIQSLLALPGQMVQAGAPLFIVQILDPVWVRVPVYVGDLAKLASDRDTEVRGLADAPGASASRGKPVLAPPSGDPLAVTVNIYYEVENKDGLLRTGQRVGVTLPLQGEDENLIVPSASLVRDIHGNTWVYVKTGDHAFSRRLIMVDRVVGDLAVVAGGKIKPGDKVVTEGTAELFGAEFGGFK